MQKILFTLLAYAILSPAAHAKISDYYPGDRTHYERSRELNRDMRNAGDTNTVTGKIKRIEGSKRFVIESEGKEIEVDASSVLRPSDTKRGVHNARQVLQEGDEVSIAGAAPTAAAGNGPARMKAGMMSFDTNGRTYNYTRNTSSQGPARLVKPVRAKKADKQAEVEKEGTPADAPEDNADTAQ